MTTAAGLVLPTFAGYTTAVVAYVIKHKRENSPGEDVTSEFALLSVVYPVLFVVFLLGAIVLKAFRWLRFEEFKGIVALIETTFAIYSTQFIRALFESPPDKT